jgi:hypothetical protein
MVSFYKNGYVIHATECHVAGKRVLTKTEVEAAGVRKQNDRVFVLVLVVLFYAFSDGCSRLVCGPHKNYLKVAEFFTAMGFVMLQHTAQAHCVKGIWDGLGKDAKQGARDAVRRGAGKATIATTKPWYDFLIDKYKIPGNADSQKRKVFGANDYFWVYYGDSVCAGTGRSLMQTSCQDLSRIMI